MICSEYILIKTDNKGVADSIQAIFDEKIEKPIKAKSFKNLALFYKSSLIQSFLKNNMKMPSPNNIVEDINLASWYSSLKNKKNKTKEEQKEILKIEKLIEKTRRRKQVGAIPSPFSINEVNNKASILAILQKLKEDNEESYKDIDLSKLNSMSKTQQIFKFLSIEALKEKELFVLHLRFVKKSTLQAIADNLGLSRERIRQIVSRATKIMKHPKIINKIKDIQEKV